MARKKSPQADATLAIDDDGDDVEVLHLIEQAFGVKFDGSASWVTVGDAYDALLATFPTSDSVGKCATTMAFFRLRRALRAVLHTEAPIQPRTRLRDLTRRSPKAVLRELSREMGLPIPARSLSWIGGIGLLLILLGVGAALMSVGFHRLWPLLFLAPLGLAAVRLDPGTFATQTVGDMARGFALRNYSAFAQLGADRRPAAIWAALVGLLGEFAEMSPAKIDRQTRLLA